jgi:hypothetical protein
MRGRFKSATHFRTYARGMFGKHSYRGLRVRYRRKRVKVVSVRPVVDSAMSYRFHQRRRQENAGLQALSGVKSISDALRCPLRPPFYHNNPWYGTDARLLKL